MWKLNQAGALRRKATSREEEVMERVTVKEAAAALSMDADCLRYMMQHGTLPIGHVVAKKTRSTYYIYKEALDSYIARMKGGSK